MTDTVRVPRAWLEAFRRDTDPTEPIADNRGTVWDMFCHEAIAMLAASPQGEEISPAMSADHIGEATNMVAPVEAVAWVLPDELADLKDPRHPRQSLTIWGHRSWTGFVPLYTNPAPIKTSADTQWIKHDGGPNPVPGTRVEVRYRNGETETRTANRLGWNHWEAETPGLGGYDIIAYRVTEGVKP